jgi:hypothetical protein
VELKKAEHNHHVGTIVTPLGYNGRLGVLLHGSIWKADADDFDRKKQPIALRPKNLRRIPPRTGKQSMSVVGSVSPDAIVAHFGERGWGLPDNVVQLISHQLLIERVSEGDISVSGCSSSRNDFPPDVVLNDDRSEWWISAPRSMPSGCGSQYLEFAFGAVPRRIEFVAMSIPPMPSGPLSVRDFHLLANDGSGTWKPASPEYKTLDVPGLQEFAMVPPVDATAIRLVCTRNAAADSDNSMCFADCIGLFQVSFA